MAFLTFFLSSWLLIGTGNIEIGEPAPDYGQMFSEILVRTGKRLQETARARPLRVKTMNDSLDATAEAMVLMASQGSEQEIDDALERAVRAYPSNSFSLLLRAVLMNSKGDVSAANYYFEQFLLRSRTYTDFEKAFIRWEEFHRLRRIVHDLLQSRGIHFKGREKQVQVRIPFSALMAYIQDPAPEDRFLNIFFVTVLLGGTLFFFWSGLTGAFDSSGYWMGTFFTLYLTAWCAYGVWIVDLAFGLPWGLSRFHTTAFLFGSVLVLRISSGIYGWWAFRHAEIEKGFRECPKCKAIVPQLVLQCPECGKELKGSRS